MILVIIDIRNSKTAEISPKAELNVTEILKIKNILIAEKSKNISNDRVKAIVPFLKFVFFEKYSAGLWTNAAIITAITKGRRYEKRTLPAKYNKITTEIANKRLIRKFFLASVPKKYHFNRKKFKFWAKICIY